MKTTKIDYTLKERWLINNFLGQVESEEMDLSKLERLSEKLVKMGPQVGPLLLKRIADCQEEGTMSRFMFLLESLDEERLVPGLVDILLRKPADDRVKARILCTLRYFDLPINGAIIGKLFPQALKPSSPAAGRFLALLEENDILLSLFLEGFYRLPKELKISITREMARWQGHRAVFLLDIFSEANDKEVALAAIAALGRIRSVKAARVLDGIIRRGLRPPLVKAARRSRLRLMFLGIRDEEVSRHPARLGEVYKVYVSRIDTYGNRYLWVARRAPEDSKLVENLCLVINDETGISDCIGASFSEKNDFDLMLKRVKQDELVVEIPYSYAVTLTKDALARNENGRFDLPAEFSLRKKIFAEDDLTPEFNPLSFPGYNLSALGRDRRLYLRGAELLDGREFEGWAIQDEDIYRLAAEWCYLDGAEAKKADRYKTAAYRRFLEQGVAPWIPILKNRLLVTADMLVHSGGPESRIKSILAAALTLEGQPELLGYHPFVRRLIAQSLEAAASVLSFNGHVDRFEDRDDL